MGRDNSAGTANFGPKLSYPSETVGIAKLAKEPGTSWNRLWSELTKLGSRKVT